MDNLTTKTATDKAAEYQPIMDENREIVFNILDTETRRAKGLRRKLAGIVYACGSLEVASAVFSGLESAWKRERTVKDEHGKVTFKPQIPASYRNTKSLILKGLENAPTLVAHTAANIIGSCEETGSPVAEARERHYGEKGEEGFLDFFGTRYVAVDKDGAEYMDDTAFFADYDRAKIYSDAHLARENRRQRDKAAKATVSGSLASGGGGEDAEALPEIVGAALNRFIAAVRGNRAAIDDDKAIADWLNDAAQSFNTWAKEALTERNTDKAANA